jgi:predicted small secreted protein
MTKLMLIAVLAALTGCATVEGIGRDISGGANRVNGWID